MQGDFSRMTFDALHRFSRVLSQQGRVQVDADWNEQVSILLHYLRTLAIDLIGPYGGPGFKITPVKNEQFTDFTITEGHFYVDGILCENKPKLGGQTTYYNQPDYHPRNTPEGEKLPSTATFLVYLDVWERHITEIEHTKHPFSPRNPNIREVALGGPDTATRTKVTWQVKIMENLGNTKPDENLDTYGLELLKMLKSDRQPANRGLVKAKAYTPPNQNAASCVTAPEAQYRGENQLYRVEVHQGGKIDAAPPPTFKWSRENGSIIFPVRQLGDGVATLAHLGRDRRLGLAPDDWVELVDDDSVERQQAGQLARVVSVNQEELTVTLLSPGEKTLQPYDEAMAAQKHLLLRRWDHKPSNEERASNQFDGALKIVETDAGNPLSESTWIVLEDGIQICFQKGSQNKEHQYRSGDYWLIPARTMTGDVEWPQDENLEPKVLPPHGVDHHYAPLAIITEASATDLRPQWKRFG